MINFWSFVCFICLLLWLLGAFSVQAAAVTSRSGMNRVFCILYKQARAEGALQHAPWSCTPAAPCGRAAWAHPTSSRSRGPGWRRGARCWWCTSSAVPAAPCDRSAPPRCPARTPVSSGTACPVDTLGTGTAWARQWVFHYYSGILVPYRVLIIIQVFWYHLGLSLLFRYSGTILGSHYYSGILVPSWALIIIQVFWYHIGFSLLFRYSGTILGSHYYSGILVPSWALIIIQVFWYHLGLSLLFRYSGTVLGSWQFKLGPLHLRPHFQNEKTTHHVSV